MGMPKHEFDKWIKEVHSYPGHFILDGIHSKLDDLLAYKPVKDGIGFYLMVKKRIVTMGAYEGAIPHIGEALFTIDGTWNLEKAGLNNDMLIEKAILRIAGQHIHDHFYSTVHKDVQVLEEQAQK